MLFMVMIMFFMVMIMFFFMLMILVFIPVITVMLMILVFFMLMLMVMVFIFILMPVLMAFLIGVDQPDGAELGEDHVVKGTVGLPEDARDRERRFVLLAHGVAGIDLIAHRQAAELRNIGAQNDLELSVRLEHRALGNVLSRQVGGGGAHQAVAVVAVRHGEGDHGGDPHILLQVRGDRVGNGSQGFIGEIHRIHGQLGLAAGRPDDRGIVSGVGGDPVADLAGNVVCQDADAGGNDDGQEHQQQLGFFHRHVLQGKTDHSASPPFTAAPFGASYMPLVTAFMSMTWSK